MHGRASGDGHRRDACAPTRRDPAELPLARLSMLGAIKRGPRVLIRVASRGYGADRLPRAARSRRSTGAAQGRINPSYTGEYRGRDALVFSVAAREPSRTRTRRGDGERLSRPRQNGVAVRSGEAVAARRPFFPVALFLSVRWRFSFICGPGLAPAAHEIAQSVAPAGHSTCRPLRRSGARGACPLSDALNAV